MRTYHCLYMEDRKQDFDRFSQNIEGIWKEHFAERLGNIQFEHVPSPAQAIKEIRDAPGKYRLFISDLLFPQDSSDNSRLVEEGLHAVEFAASVSGLAILALSGGAQLEHWGLRERFLERARLASGKDYVEKIEFLQMSREQFRQILEKVLSSQLHELTLDDTEAERIISLGSKADLMLRAQVETVGLRNIAQLARNLVHDYAEFDLHSMAQGFSGAYVFSLLSYTANRIQKGPELALKVSRDEHKLRTELSSAPKPGDTIPGVYIEYRCREPVAVDGWWGITAALQGQSVSLHDWLTVHRVKKSSIVKTLEELFAALDRDYEKKLFQADTTAPALLWGSIYSRARASAALEEFRTLIETHASQPTDLSVLSDFCDDMTIPRIEASSIKAGVFTCVCHGDLHTRNILVVPATGRPYVIDPARRKQCHWASDIARLTSSIFVDLWDYGPPSYEWESLDGWRELFNQWISGQNIQLTSNNPNAPMWNALRWLRSVRTRHLRPAVGSDLPAWEERLALAVEFLLMSTYPQTPAPKRAFALLAAVDSLSTIADLFRP